MDGQMDDGRMDQLMARQMDVWAMCILLMIRN